MPVTSWNFTGTDTDDSMVIKGDIWRFNVDIVTNTERDVLHFAVKRSA